MGNRLKPKGWLLGDPRHARPKTPPVSATKPNMAVTPEHPVLQRLTTLTSTLATACRQIEELEAKRDDFADMLIDRLEAVEAERDTLRAELDRVKCKLGGLERTAIIEIKATTKRAEAVEAERDTLRGEIEKHRRQIKQREAGARISSNAADADLWSLLSQRSG